MERIDYSKTPEIGKKVEVIIHLMRHGKKDIKGGLSVEGAREATEKGKDIDFKPNVKTYTSSVNRVKQTAEALLQDAEIENLMTTRIRHELSADLMRLPGAKTSPFFTNVVMKRLSEAYNEPEDVREQRIKDVETTNMQDWLNFGDNQPDEYTTSPKMVAQAVSSHLLRQIEMVDKLKDDTKLDLFDVTHEFMIAAIIKYAVEGINKEGEIVSGTEIMQGKGSVDYLEDVKIVIGKNTAGEKTITVEMGGKEYKMNMDALRELANGYRDSSKKKL